MDRLTDDNRSRSTVAGADRHSTGSPHLTRPKSKTVSVEYAAAELGVGRTTLYQAIKRGEVPVLRIGRRVVIRRSTITRLLADPDALPQLLLDDPDTATP